MTNEQIEITLKFLSRVDLKGSEAPALVSVIRAIQALAEQDKMPNVEHTED